ncbi:HAMP domain-containing histidine kinase [Cytobacillus spongiae]|uniref:sensor histidine kinase n=1 Tax=Cytobacillus spongiae TaxID=2901381 RepID=UPI001F4856D9|nr:HAMP domain-containing sensor histidine kinase [Cytobacillus spongiae]UII54202.1 HAMP domain-containing histidine kinase [Cytobacillus spongiae]
MLNEILLNILFILVGVFFHHFWSEKTGVYFNKMVISIVFATTIALCVPFSFEGAFLSDLKMVPYIIGSFYGGILVSLFLFSVMVAFYLLFYGITEFYPLFIGVYGSLGMICGLLSTKFQNSNQSKKLSMMTTISFFWTVLLFLLCENEIGKNNTHILLFTPALATFVTGYIMDAISEITILRQQVIKSEKSEVVSQLAASVSHEVRNPLTVTRGFLQLVLESEQLPVEKRNEYMRLAIEELDTASNIINDYLTYAKPAPAYWELMDIGKQLNRIEDIIYSYAQMSSVEIRTELVSCIIQGNKQQFQQCFLNITKNCIEAMPGGGILTIYTSIFDKHVLVEISDTGIGMTKEQMNRLGEPYFSTKEKGTGLGMMVVLSIVKGMKGSFSTESELGKGTKFSITFPIAVPK